MHAWRALAFYCSSLHYYVVRICSLSRPSLITSIVHVLPAVALRYVANGPLAAMHQFAALRVIVASFVLVPSSAFQFPNISFLPPSKTGASTSSSSLTQKKAELLELVSNTENGKTAAPPLQAKVLSIVREIEKASPFGSLQNPSEAAAIDGTWFLRTQVPRSWKMKRGCWTSGLWRILWSLGSKRRIRR